MGGALTWLVALGVAVAAAHPEGCHTPTTAEAQEAAEAAVGWLTDNQRADGAFLYRYDRVGDEDIRQYNIVRHAGVLLSLAQARGAGIDAATGAFQSGLAWAEERIVDTTTGAALTEGRSAETGAAALLAAALVEWREATGDTDNDALLREVGRFVEARVLDDGAVVALVDSDTGADVIDSRSPFSTGEAAWALAALHTTFPTEGWDESARRVVRYVATDRDDSERRFPPVSDHWVAYALAEIGVDWETPLTDDEQRLLHRQAGLFGLQTRYESQRRQSGIVRWTRGPIALGAGVGTLGEGLGAVLRLAPTDDAAAALEGQATERIRCVAGLLVDRQAQPEDLDDEPRPGRIAGAWFRQGVTQMDDQQHALSALLAAIPSLPDDRRSNPEANR